jgi:hypothetical protein
VNLTKPYILAILNDYALGRVDVVKSAFIKGRNIHEGVVSLQEIIHETKAKRLRGVFLKLDFEKTYDRVDWAFPREVLIMTQDGSITPFVWSRGAKRLVP